MAVSLDSYSDIEDDLDQLNESFNRAAEHVKSLVATLEPPKLLEIYAYYKIATEGSCNILRPRWYEMQAKAKWDAWNALGKLPPEIAKKNYIRIISELDTTFDPSTSAGNSETWVTVSCLANTDETLQDSDKTVFDYVKEGDLNKLIASLKSNSVVIHNRDETGLGLIHWAADRGCLDILKHLVNSKIDVNMIDEDGQTALHYAASCDHLDCVKFLIDMGADSKIKDADGTLPVDLASDSDIIELLTV